MGKHNRFSDYTFPLTDGDWKEIGASLNALTCDIGRFMRQVNHENGSYKIFLTKKRRTLILLIILLLKPHR